GTARWTLTIRPRSRTRRLSAAAGASSRTSGPSVCANSSPRKPTTRVKNSASLWRRTRRQRRNEVGGVDPAPPQAPRCRKLRGCVKITWSFVVRPNGIILHGASQKSWPNLGHLSPSQVDSPPERTKDRFLRFLPVANSAQLFPAQHAVA